MKQYRLLKDLPGLEKGSILSEGKSLFGARTLITKNDVGHIFISNNLSEELFEEIKEPVDSIHWTPKKDDEYFWMNSYGETQPDVWDGDSIDSMRLALGMVYRTEEECEKARDRELAKVRLQRTSTFKPDFENENGGWVVFYSYVDKELHSMRDSCTDSGELVRYETEEDAKRSIRENREDWLIYFGIDPSDTNES